MAVSLYDVLGMKKTATAEQIKSAYRALAKRYHPDTNPGNTFAEEKFKELAAAYAVLGDPQKRAKYDSGAVGGPITLQTRMGRFVINGNAFTGEVADIYEAIKEDTGEVFALKVARSPRDNDLLENEAKVLKEIYPSDVSSHKYHLYLPKLIGSLKIDDGSRRQANLMQWLNGYYSLEKVRAAHPRLQMEHGVWMFNRMLEFLGYLHNKQNRVHGAVIPPHALVYAGTQEKDILNHGARLVGWSYSVQVGGTIKAISPEYEAFYPPEIFAKRPVSPATDIYMAAKSIIHVLGGDVRPGADVYPGHIPNYFLNFLRSCTIKSPASRPQDAWALHRELKDHMRVHYGPKKYVPFHMPSPA